MSAMLPARSLPPSVRVPVLLACTLLLVLSSLPAFAQEGASLTWGVRPDGSSAAAPADAHHSPGAPEVERVANGLNAPVLKAFGPDGRLFYGEWKTGNVYELGENGRPKDYGNPVLAVGTPAWGNERGFLGLAIDNEYNFYTFTTYDRADGKGWFNRVSKWVDGQEVVLLDDLDADDWHNAGRIAVDPAGGILWVSYGDVNKYSVAQDVDDLRGSILRMTTDGAPAEGNVKEGGYVWSYGHRQPFSFAVDFRTGRVMSAENMDKKNDEVNFVVAGGNYGWPVCEGPCDPPREDLTDPVVYYERTVGPTSGVWLDGYYVFGTFNTGQLHRVYQDPSDDLWYDEVIYRHEKPPIIDVTLGPEGNTIYFSTWNEIWRLTFPDVDPENPRGGADLEDPGDNGQDPNGGTNGDGDGDDEEETGSGDLPASIPGPGGFLLAAAFALAACIGVGALGRARR